MKKLGKILLLFIFIFSLLFRVDDFVINQNAMFVKANMGTIGEDGKAAVDFTDSEKKMINIIKTLAPGLRKLSKAVQNSFSSGAGLAKLIGDSEAEKKGQEAVKNYEKKVIPVFNDKYNIYEKVDLDASASKDSELAAKVRAELVKARQEIWEDVKKINDSGKVASEYVKGLAATAKGKSFAKEADEAEKIAAQALAEGEALLKLEVEMGGKGYASSGSNVTVIPSDPYAGYEKPDDYVGPLPDCAFKGNCKDVNVFLELGINYAKLTFGMIGAVALLMFVYGGFLMLISMGNTERTKKGKDVMVNAVIGIIIAFGAFLLVNFFLDTLGVTGDFNAFKQ